MKTGKLKKQWEERVNKRKAKPSKVCKVHKGPHIFDQKDDDFLRDSIFSGYMSLEEVTFFRKCLCGKKGHIKKKLESGEMLESFILYCKQHPEEHFWLALRNWSVFKYIYGSRSEKEIEGLYDTVYMDKK